MPWGWQQRGSPWRRWWLWLWLGLRWWSWLMQVVAVAAPVRVATVSPLRQSGLGLFPMASALPQVSKVVCRLLRGLYHPVLGLALAQERCLVLGLAPPSAAFGPDHPTQLPFCFSSPSWASSAWGLSWVSGLHLLCLLGFLPGWRPHGSTFSPIRLGCWALLWLCP